MRVGSGAVSLVTPIETVVPAITNPIGLDAIFVGALEVSGRTTLNRAIKVNRQRDSGLTFNHDVHRGRDYARAVRGFAHV